MRRAILSLGCVACAALAQSNDFRFRAAFELGPQLLSPETSASGISVLGVVTPIVAVDAPGQWNLELGAALRLRLIDPVSSDRASDIGILRGRDWKELSDVGQLLRALRIGGDDSAVTLRAGPLRLLTLGRGALIDRYSNLTQENYHPAGAQLSVALAPVRLTAFASDVLGGRIFAGHASLDLARMLSRSESAFDRFHLDLSAAADFGRAGDIAPPLSMAAATVDAGLIRGEDAQIFAYLSGGARLGLPALDAGALLGLAADLSIGASAASARLELRRVGGAFRFGVFGPGYELARFSGVGLSSMPLALERLPDAFSLFAEASYGAGAIDEWSQAPLVRASASSEVFSFGRTDLDFSLAFRSLEARAIGTLRANVVGIGVAPRFFLSGELRYRIASAVYVLLNGGTAYFPQVDGTLRRGVFAGLGAGVDFER